jgi:hypothetical protein
MEMFMRIALRSGFFSGLCVLMMISSGCGNAKVSNETSMGAPTTKPQTVYVGNFDLGEALIQTDPGTLTGRPRFLSLSVLHGNEDPAQQIAALQELLESDIVKDLNEAGMPAERLDVSGARPTQGWLVTGEFLDLQEGNRVQRAVIGFGVGSSDAKLYVTLADVAHPEGQNLLNFNGESTGDQTPGGSITAVADHSPWGMVAKYAIDRDASEKDISKIAQAVSDEIVKFAQGK